MTAADLMPNPPATVTVPAPVAGPVVTPSEALWQRLLIAQAVKAIVTLREAGISCLLIKGAAGLAAGWWSPGERPLLDVDILLQPGRLREAVQVLTDSGWTLDFSVPAVPDAYRHSGPMISPHGFQLDLHWYSLRHFRWPGVDDRLWAGAVPAVLGGVEVLTPAPEDFLVHTIAHGARRDSMSEVWMADSRALLAEGKVPWNWSRFIQTASHYRAGSAMAKALGQLDSVRIPSPILKQLRDLPTKRGDDLFLHLTTHYWQEAGLAQVLVVGLDFIRTRPPQGLDAPGEFLDYLKDRWEVRSRREMVEVFMGQFRLWMARQSRRLQRLGGKA